MGFFSWHTQDTDKSIANRYSVRKPFTVYMKDDKGNVWKEDNYEGYGVFGGKDYLALVAEMNGVTGDSEDIRGAGISMYFDDNMERFIYPSLSEDPNYEWTGEAPIDCEYQGYFYEDEEITNPKHFEIKRYLNESRFYLQGKFVGRVSTYEHELPHLNLPKNHYWFRAEYDYRSIPEFHSLTLEEVIGKVLTHFKLIDID